MSLSHLTLASVLIPLVVAGNWQLPGTDGHSHSWRELSQAKATVLIFVATDCPISNRYSPLLHRLESSYRLKGIRFFAVFSGPGIDMETVRKHQMEYGLDMPGLIDTADVLARRTGARVTPEAAVVSPDGTVLYRGRIDNQYVTWGQTRNEATANDLQNALDSILASRPIAEWQTKALGCAINGLEN